MKTLDFINKDTLHHAYLIEGEYESTLAQVSDFIAGELGVAVSGNPDVSVEKVTLLGIEDARRLRALHADRPLGQKKFFIVGMDSATLEAQNALLKILEEPNFDTHFFLIVPRLGVYLPTLRSRFFEISLNATGTTSSAEKFLQSSVVERIKLLEPLIEKLDTKEERHEKKSEILSFLDALEVVLAKNVTFKRNDPEAFADLLKARQYVTLSGAAVRLILEHLALVLPRPKS